MNATRLTLGLPIAAGVTGALFLLMRALIFTEPGQLPEAVDDLRVDINPEVDVIQHPGRMTIEDLDDVIPPPPVPVLDRTPSDAPHEDLATIVGPLPDIEPPTITAGNVNFEVGDRNAQPLVRIPPTYPPRLLDRGVEGTCTVQFDVAPNGTPTNISATSCTNNGFSSASIRAVERWRYSPKIQNGEAVARYGVVTDIDFRFEDS